MIQIDKHPTIFSFVLIFFMLAACGTAVPPTPSSPDLPTAVSATLVVADITVEPTGITLSPPTRTPALSSPTPQPTATVEPSPTATATPDYPVYAGVPLQTAEMGIQIHLHNEDTAALLDHIATMQLGWVKTQVSWKLFQPDQDRYDDVLFAELDELIDLAEQRGISVMLGVAKAPEWSRATTEMDGPPLESTHFAQFMLLLATRYKGRVTAYELWNETNLQREWNGAPLNGSGLVTLIAAGSGSVRAVDPEALILSGAPAPTGINDGVSAVDDRVYFQQMIAAGLPNWVDGFGIHPYGWVNPPASRFGSPDPRTSSHNDHPSFFAGDTIADYTKILEDAGVDPAQQQLWATEFGWGSVDRFGEPPVVGAEFMTQVDERAQASYIADAFALGQANRAMGPMILWNLNFAPTFGTAFSESAYSVIRPDGSVRPAYNTLATAVRQ